MGKATPTVASWGGEELTQASHDLSREYWPKGLTVRKCWVGQAFQGKGEEETAGPVNTLKAEGAGGAGRAQVLGAGEFPQHRKRR